VALNDVAERPRDALPPVICVCVCVCVCAVCEEIIDLHSTRSVACERGTSSRLQTGAGGEYRGWTQVSAGDQQQTTGRSTWSNLFTGRHQQSTLLSRLQPSLAPPPAYTKQVQSSLSRFHTAKILPKIYRQQSRDCPCVQLA